MKKNDSTRILSAALLMQYSDHLKQQEKADATVQKYIHDLNRLLHFLPGGRLTKSALILWKEQLCADYAAASVNTMLAAVNGMLDYCGWGEMKLKPLKIQKELFLKEEKELTRAEYTRLVRAAEAAGSKRLSLILQTICSTGIRVSELKFVTVEALDCGRVEVANKGKRRTVFLPGQLRAVLRRFSRQQKRTAGPVFVTRSGKPIDRSNIWRDMKALCVNAGVSPEKVFPHNLRHLFARTYYSMEKDLSRLADILGHSNVNTTRIYTMESGIVHAEQIGRLGLVIT